MLQVKAENKMFDFFDMTNPKDRRMVAEFFTRYENILPKYPRGIWYSELMAFLAILLMYRQKFVLIESGIYLGQSTEIIQFFNKTQQAFLERHYIIDKRFKKDFCNSQQGLDVVCIEGDALSEIPALLDGLKKDNVAILLDGPKGTPAVLLAERCLGYKKVKFVAIHDSYKESKARQEIEEKFKDDFWSTDDLKFIKRYKILDRDKYDKWMDENRKGWLPYQKYYNDNQTRTSVIYSKIHQPVSVLNSQSYGPTLTFIFQNSKKRD